MSISFCLEWIEQKVSFNTYDKLQNNELQLLIIQQINGRDNLYTPTSGEIEPEVDLDRNNRGFKRGAQTVWNDKVVT